MSDASTLGAFFACLLFCPSEGLPLQEYEPMPTLVGSRYDCRRAPADAVWVGRLTGRNDFGDRVRTISVTGCFESRRECERILDRFDGLTFGNVYRRCRRGEPPA